MGDIPAIMVDIPSIMADIPAIMAEIPALMADIPALMADLDARRWADLLSQIPQSPIQTQVNMETVDPLAVPTGHPKCWCCSGAVPRGAPVFFCIL